MIPVSKKQRQANKRGEQLTPEEWSAEQLEHKQENDGREKDPIEDRKTDGPNIPST